MKLYEIEHINEDRNPNAVMGAELVFLAAICPITGARYEPLRQPAEWGHVKRLTQMLFLAWDDTNPFEGTVYLGAFVRRS
jgi:hypothetical protein